MAFSALDIAMKEFEREAEARAALRPAEPWPEGERSEEKRADRVARALDDFAAFDDIYFAPEQYDRYAPPGEYHRQLVADALTPGIGIQAGPRDFAKTATAKKFAAWLVLSARETIIATLSQTLPTASNLLVDIRKIIQENPRIREDFGVVLREANTKQFQLTTTAPGTPKGWRFGAAFSEGKSMRGFSHGFGRPGWTLADDIETLVSPMSDKHVQERIDFVEECYKSMTSTGTLLWLCNIFDVRCAPNVQKKRKEQGVLPAHWRVTIRSAWDDERGSLWPERFPATSEEEMRAMVRASSEADWQGNFQQSPIPPEGIVFLSSYYTTIRPDDMPRNTISVIYADQNTSLRGLGDTTAILRIEYSPSTQKFYVRAARCKSYADVNDLIDDYMRIWLLPGVKARAGFDGHVSQEATWENHIRNWARRHEVPMLNIHWCKYRVDLCATNTSGFWSSGSIVFVEGWAPPEEKERALRQLYGFSSKKDKRKDDFPDGLICGIELLHEVGIAKRFEEAVQEDAQQRRPEERYDPDQPGPRPYRTASRPIESSPLY